MQDFLPILKKALKQNHIKASDDQCAQFATYLTLMRTWNKVFNLTAITDPTEMVYLHIIDSLMMLPFLQGTMCLDVGSGAGLPGIPLAIMQPERQWTLVDKNNKKTTFMTQAIAELGLKNARAVHVRSEAYQPDEKFDSILSRAFGSLALFIETTEKLLNPDGLLLAMKGKYPHDELAAIPSHFEAAQISQISLKGITIDRHVVCLRAK